MEGSLRVVVKEAQNVPFEESYTEVKTRDDTFATRRDAGSFPRYESENRFMGVQRGDIIEVSLWESNGSERMVGALNMAEFEDQKVHDRWVPLTHEGGTVGGTDVKVRIMVHFVYSKVAVCEEAIEGWKRHIGELE